MNTIIIVSSFLLLVVLLYQEKKNDRKKILVTKVFLSSLFVFTALLQPHPVPAFTHLLLVGLIFCLVGDGALALPGERMFQMGLAAFLLGHVLYILSFAFLLGITFWISPVALLFFLVSTGIFLWLRPFLKSMAGPVWAYILVITLMLSGAWAVLQKSSIPAGGMVFLFAGALFFYLSDIFVARDRFIRAQFSNRLLGLPLYYAGQFSLAFSVGLLK